MDKQTSYDTEFSEELGVDKSELTIEEKNNEKKEEEGEESYQWKYNELKYKYNKTLIRLVSRDPNRLYAYWEVTEPEFYQHHPVLRLYAENEKKHYDIDIYHEAESWYISQVKPQSEYKVAIGYKKDGTFYTLSQSNTIRTPSDRPSDNLDEKWMYIQELEKYTYRIEINSTLSLIESMEKRKEKEHLNISSYPFNE
ncbi:MAG: DUF4912 domain-containing protein [Bacillota bacterium]